MNMSTDLARNQELEDLKRGLDCLRECRTIVEQKDLIDGFAESDPCILESDWFSQETFLLDTLHLLKIDSSSSFIEGVSKSLVSAFDHFALLNASFKSIRELGSGPKVVSESSTPPFEHEVTTLYVTSSIIRLLIFDENCRLWDTDHDGVGCDRLFSLLLSIPSFVSRAYRRLNEVMPQDYIPELFQKKLVAATVEHEVFPTVVRLVLRRNKGSAIGPGLAGNLNHLAAATKRLQDSLTDREKAELVRCILEFGDLSGSSANLLQRLCCPLVDASLEECCRRIILPMEVSHDITHSNRLSSSFAELCQLSSTQPTTENDDEPEWREELDRIDEKDHILWKALIEVATVWSSAVYVRQTDHTCQSRATSFILRALEIVSANPIPWESVVPMSLMSGVSARLNSTHKSIRLDGMRVGEQLAKRLGEEVRFDELHAEPTAPAAVAETSHSPSNIGRVQLAYGREDDDSSEGSVDFATFDLEDDQEDLLDVQRPLYLSECLNYFRTPEGEDNALLRIEVGLKSVAQLVRSMPADLQDYAPELARSIVHLENKSSMDKFEEISAEALRSLVVMAPLAVGNCLIEDLFLRDSALGNRMAILHALSDAALELSGAITEDAITSPLTSALTSNHHFAPTTSNEQLTNHHKDQWQKSRCWDSSVLRDVLPIWFYLISKHFVNTAENETLWGGENGALLLSKVIGTMSCIVNSVANHSAAIDIIAMDFHRLVWSFKDAETPEVRSAVIEAAGVVVRVVSVDLKRRLIQDESVDGLLPCLARYLESDPDQRCRAIAESSINEVVAASNVTTGSNLIIEHNAVQ